MSHVGRLTQVIERALQELGLTGAYRVDVYRANALDDWRALLVSPDKQSVIHLQFIVSDDPDWSAVLVDAKRQIQPRARRT